MINPPFIPLFGFFGFGRSKQEQDAIQSENERNFTTYIETNFPLLSSRVLVGITKPITKKPVTLARNGLGRPNRTGMNK